MFYGAYGSNLNKSQMAWRCPGASEAGTAVLKDYRLMFKGSKSGAYLTVEKEKGYEVPLGIWEVNEDHVKSLNRYEGFPDFYYIKEFNLKCNDGKRHKVFVYIMHEDRKLATPNSYYIKVCQEGYRDFGFDEDILIDAIFYSRRGENEEDNT